MLISPVEVRSFCASGFFCGPARLRSSLGFYEPKSHLLDFHLIRLGETFFWRLLHVFVVTFTFLRSTEGNDLIQLQSEQFKSV